MNYCFLFTLFIAAAPFVASSYASVDYDSQDSNGLQPLARMATAGNPDLVQPNKPTPAEHSRLGQASAQLSTLNANPTYNNLQNSEDIAVSLAGTDLASNIRQGNVNLVSPNVVNQDIHRSLLVPSGPNNHNVIATQQLPAIIVNQPGASPIEISSGPAAIVKAAPVIYKIKPSVIYQQEIVNKVPTPLNMAPVYVKVYKPGKQISAPTAPVVREQSYGHNHAYDHGAAQIAAAPAAGAYGSAAPSLAYASQAAPAYSSQAAPAYSSQAAPAYSSQTAVYANQVAAPAYPQVSY